MKPNTTPTISRVKSFFRLGVIAIATIAALAFSAPAHAVSYESVTSSEDAWNDAGGRNATARLVSGSTHYHVFFAAHGETLSLWDHYQDGHLAIGQVKVYNNSGSLVDRDEFQTGKLVESYNLGTPDGSGNIVDGYTVKVRVCISGIWVCSGWATGRA